MCSAIPEGGCFADVQELRLKHENFSDLGCAELQGVLFADCQEWQFQATKRSDMSSIFM